MKKMLLIFAVGGTMRTNAQIWKKATESAKKSTEKQVEKRSEKAVDKAFDKAEDAVTGKVIITTSLSKPDKRSRLPERAQPYKTELLNSEEPLWKWHMPRTILFPATKFSLKT